MNEQLINDLKEGDCICFIQDNATITGKLSRPMKIENETIKIGFTWATDSSFDYIVREHYTHIIDKNISIILLTQ